MNITVEHNPSPGRLRALEVHTWEIWTKEVSTFPWHYEEQEVCYFLEGRVEATPEGGAPVTFGRGDLVTFPEGMSCIWKVLEPVRKHYRFG